MCGCTFFFRIVRFASQHYSTLHAFDSELCILLYVYRVMDSPQACDLADRVLHRLSLAGPSDERKLDMITGGDC